MALELELENRRIAVGDVVVQPHRGWVRLTSGGAAVRLSPPMARLLAGALEGLAAELERHQVDGGRTGAG